MMKLMALAHLSEQMVSNLSDFGRKISRRDLAPNYGKMVLYFKEFIETVKRMVLEFSNGSMDLATWASFTIITFKDKAHLFGPTSAYTKANGTKIKCMEWALSDGPTDKNSLENM